MIKLILITFTLLLLNSCNEKPKTPVHEQFAWDLGAGYTYMDLELWNQIFPQYISYQTKIDSRIINYNFDKKYIIVKQRIDSLNFRNMKISDLETDFRMYDGYLVYCSEKDFLEETTAEYIEYISSKYEIYRVFKNKGLTYQDTINQPIIIELYIDSLFENDPFYIKLFSMDIIYWVIDKENHIRYGPLSKSEFDQFLVNQNIDLKFDRNYEEGYIEDRFVE